MSLLLLLTSLDDDSTPTPGVIDLSLSIQDTTLDVVLVVDIYSEL